MEFDKSRVFSAVNADELRAGDKVMVADNLNDLEIQVMKWQECDIEVLKEIKTKDYCHRFVINTGRTQCLAYLVERAENCTNCVRKDTLSCNQCDEVSAIYCCDEYKPKTEQKAEKKNCYNCRLTYTRDGVMRCMMNDHRCNNPEVACNHYEPTTFEKHYRPFRDADELIKVWLEKGSKWQKREITMPFIWVRYKNLPKSKGMLIDGFEDNIVYVTCADRSMQELFDKFTFLDGSPCGVEE